jgi:hypothetical protein
VSWSKTVLVVPRFSVGNCIYQWTGRDINCIQVVRSTPCAIQRIEILHQFSTYMTLRLIRLISSLLLVIGTFHEDETVLFCAACNLASISQVSPILVADLTYSEATTAGRKTVDRDGNDRKALC